MPAYNYSQAGAYFITVCTQNRVMLFGEVVDCDVQLNKMGMIVRQTWDDLPTHYPWRMIQENISRAASAERRAGLKPAPTS
jgi:hypothetical protein